MGKDWSSTRSLKPDYLIRRDIKKPAKNRFRGSLLPGTGDFPKGKLIKKRLEYFTVVLNSYISSKLSVPDRSNRN
jgi:hypothetical protein